MQNYCSLSVLINRRTKKQKQKEWLPYFLYSQTHINKDRLSLSVQNTKQLLMSNPLNITQIELLLVCDINNQIWL